MMYVYKDALIWLKKVAMQKKIRTKLDYLELLHVSKHDQLIYVQF
jgi:hypothetical protein